MHRILLKKLPMLSYFHPSHFVIVCVKQKYQVFFANKTIEFFFLCSHFCKKKLTLLIFPSLAEEDFSLNGGGFRKLESSKKSKKQIILLKVY